MLLLPSFTKTFTPAFELLLPLCFYDSGDSDERGNERGVVVAVAMVAMTWGHGGNKRDAKEKARIKIEKFTRKNSFNLLCLKMCVLLKEQEI